MKLSLGNAIDQLSIVNMKIFKAEDIKRDPNATDKEIADATKSTNVLNTQRNDLIAYIDNTINHMIKTGELQKVYGANKMYGKKESK